nr:hypothetical protein [Hyphomonas sp. Mor2]
MEQQGFLIGFAQLALVLTGFVSIFVVFQVDQTSKSRVITHHAASILVGSLVAFIGALIPIVLYNFDVTGATLWWWSSLILSGFGAVYFASMLRMTFGLTWAQFKEAGILHMFFSYSTGMTSGGLLVWNVLEPAAPGFYIAACILNLLAALIGFITFSVQKILYW